MDTYRERAHEVGSETLTVVVARLARHGHPVTRVLYTELVGWAPEIARANGVPPALYWGPRGRGGLETRARATRPRWRGGLGARYRGRGDGLGASRRRRQEEGRVTKEEMRLRQMERGSGAQ